MSDSSQHDLISYPEGCKPVAQGMTVEKLRNRLKVLATSFQNMGDEAPRTKSQLKQLCVYLTDDFFLQHKEKDVRLLTANILADVLRVYSPAPPYSSNTLRTVLDFLIQELTGLKNPNDRTFTRSFYLLENLNHSKCFNLLSDHKDLTLKLFSTVFKLVNEAQTQRIKNFLVELLAPLWDANNEELLCLIMMNIIEPAKSHRPDCYELASVLIRRCSDSIASALQGFLIRTLIETTDTAVPDQPVVAHRVVDLIGELHVICPALLHLVWPHMDLKIRNVREAERIKAVGMLGPIFSTEYCKLASDQPGVWQAFLGRFNDISSDIRLTCVSYAADIFLYHESLREDILEALKSRFTDCEEAIRLEVVKSMISVGMSDLGLITEDVQDFLGLRTMDKKEPVRREAIQGLGNIYKQNVKNLDHIPAHVRPTIRWMQNTILRTYRGPEIVDKMAIERILPARLVDFRAPPAERILKLVYLYLGLDDFSATSFSLLQQTQVGIRMKVKQLLDYVEAQDWSTESETRNNQLAIIARRICMCLPDPTRAQGHLIRFAKSLKTDKAMAKLLKITLDPESESSAHVQATRNILTKLEPQNTTYYKVLKAVLERSASVLIDTETARELFTILFQLAEGDEDLMMKLDVESGVASLHKTLVLLRLLCVIHPNHFSREIANIIRLIGRVPGTSRYLLYSSITAIVSRTGKKLEPSIMGFVYPKCKQLILEGSGREAKAAIKCIGVNSTDPANCFNDIIPLLHEHILRRDDQFINAIMSLGNIAVRNPTGARVEIRRIMKKLVKTIILTPPRRPEDQARNEDDGNWCAFEDLPDITQAMIVAMKAVVRWLIGMGSGETDTGLPAKTNDVLIGYVGGMMNPSIPYSQAEKSWLRISAANAFLLLCRFKGVGDQYTPLQLSIVAGMFADPVAQVRQMFGVKLYKGLTKGLAISWYPVEFLGMYALAGYETDKKHLKRIKSKISDIFDLRLNAVEEYKLRGDETSLQCAKYFMPEYIIIYALPYLSVSNPRFTDRTSIEQLEEVKRCLWTLFDPLMKLQDYTYSFYAQMIQGIKDSQQKLRPEDNDANLRMYAVCDLATGLLMQKSKNTDSGQQVEPLIPEPFFQYIEPNHRSYLPESYANFKPSPARPKVVPQWKRKLLEEIYENGEEDLDMEITRLIENGNESTVLMTPKPRPRAKKPRAELEPIQEASDLNDTPDTISQQTPATDGTLASSGASDETPDRPMKTGANQARKPVKRPAARGKSAVVGAKKPRGKSVSKKNNDTSDTISQQTPDTDNTLASSGTSDEIPDRPKNTSVNQARKPVKHPAARVKSVVVGAKKPRGRPITKKNDRVTRSSSSQTSSSLDGEMSVNGKRKASTPRAGPSNKRAATPMRPRGKPAKKTVASATRSKDSGKRK